MNIILTSDINISFIYNFQSKSGVNQVKLKIMYFLGENDYG